MSQRAASALPYGPPSPRPPLASYNNNILVNDQREHPSSSPPLMFLSQSVPETQLNLCNRHSGERPTGALFLSQSRKLNLCNRHWSVGVASKCVAAPVSPANVSPHERRAVTPRSRSNDQRSSPSRSRIAVCAPPRHTRTRVARACSALQLRACSAHAVPPSPPSTRAGCARSRRAACEACGHGVEAHQNNQRCIRPSVQAGRQSGQGRACGIWQENRGPDARAQAPT